MDINDKVYGLTTIDEPVLVELIKSKPLQRLNGIHQLGASQYAIRGESVTRYDHSVGVMILLSKLGASTEEQIAGLLHDTPHTAFSHVIDFVFKENNHNQEFHEKFYEKIIVQSEIPRILKKYDFDVNRILDDSNFPLLERNLPDLCADRIDYTLRDMTAYYGFSDKINEYISSFVVYDNEIIVNNAAIAKKFAEDNLQMNKEVWSHPREVALFQILADAIKIAMDDGILTENDLFEDDLSVYTKLKESGNKLITQKLSMLNPNLNIIDNPDDFDFHSINKLRYINPKYLGPDGSVNRVADTFKDYSEKLVAHKKWIERGHFVKVVSY
ncbi:MAG: HD domain-containing protein [Candidatus Aenigmarchaeota archaeon]|nr:HD domain-containing protein [Candidatus Aenigmarchaeota archaeon]